MKYIISAMAFLLVSANVASAQMMGYQNTRATDSQTQQDEAAGKEIWQKLVARQIDCSSLTDDNYDVLGDYFMGQMMGNYHSAMNDMMTRNMGKGGERNMHISMGKRFSGCEASSAQSNGPAYYWPMMGMMSGGWGNVRSVGYGLLPLGILGFVIAVLWHLFWVVLFILFVRWIYRGFRRKNFWGGSALSILKERYARGEINKEEFEAKKADINK